MTVAIFYGSTKPLNVEEYLRSMIEEMNFLIEHGIVINGKNIAIKLRAIIADTPARSFVKGIVGHTGYAGCMKCTVHGEYNKAGRTVVFPGVNAPKRTDQGFREHEYPKHCKVRTPLLDLRGFDMINDVIVADRLHLIDLGVMKRLLIGWRDGSLGTKRWSTTQCDQITGALGIIKLPIEIHRPLRPIVYAGRWKGSEFASFLHYASIVVLKEHVSQDCYQHFLLFFCGVTLLSSSVYRRKWPLAGQLLEQFVAQYSVVYGERYVGSNVHNLQHIYEEVARLGPLPSLSTYPFENELQHLKGLLRGGNKNLEQAINRLSELDNFHMSSYKESMAPNTPLCRENGKFSILRVRRNFVLRNDSRNCWFLTKDNNIMRDSFNCFNSSSQSMGEN
ncbi:uncharacterized protein LOC131284262 [Anopheles ziemanni]|uniref:uncharacterized protein LOC131272203 n=1 Tax=Anopheles coustani TaxID=139045 RepID=UPI00265AD9AB|nr:uncharacterized protein LOC131272203 [Anopheles coustani]XP_058169098.1 uncharacterized protein LOC131284262 [Anopheles ziemanni]